MQQIWWRWTRLECIMLVKIWPKSTLDSSIIFGTTIKLWKPFKLTIWKPFISGDNISSLKAWFYFSSLIARKSSWKLSDLLVCIQGQHPIKSPYFLLRHFLASWKCPRLLYNSTWTMLISTLNRRTYSRGFRAELR